MARLVDKNPANIDGEWYVDTRCIDCDVSRHHAPGLIEADPDGLSIVIRQPANPDEELLMWRAALACPTRSIGTVERQATPDDIYPWELTPGVFLNGHNSRHSFGAHSYWVPRPDGGLLIDAPQWSRDVVTAMEAHGGLAHVLLSHRDDIADAEKFVEHFDARVWIHETDAYAAPFATDLLRGTDETEIEPGIVGFPVPGHTQGSVLYLVDEKWLFTGDSFAWFHREGQLGAFRGATWYSWDAQRESLARFAATEHTFEWVFPGHGKWHGATATEMHTHLDALVARM